ncbi:MAG: opine dehydrogenase, partial [Gammaproteobacteria bacterium]|nr:opine dehydrogenase [Gammaproteobacteria bacterium]
GLVFMSRLARQLGVATPTIDAMIQVTSVLMARDYASEALRTPATLGIEQLSAGELGRL